MSTLKLKGSTSGYVELTAPAIAGNNAITLPTTAGTLVLKDPSNNFEVGTGVTIGAGTSNTFTLSTNGSERIRVDSSGRLGIGTTNPTSTLQVIGNTNISGVLTATTASISSNASVGGVIVSGVTTVAAGSTSAPSISPSGDSNTGIFFPSADTIAFAEGGTEVLRIDSNGNIGIGTTNPTTELEVLGTGTVASFRGKGGNCFIGIKDEDDGTLAFIGVDGGTLKFQTSGSSYSDKLIIDTSGNIGIRTTNPAKTLDVRGEATFGSGITISDLSWGKDTNQLVYTFSGTAGAGNPSDGLVALVSPNANPSATRVGSLVFGNKVSGTSVTTNPGLKGGIDCTTNTNVANAADTGAYLNFYTKVDNGSFRTQMILNSNGVLTKPYQPSFFAYRTTTLSVTGGTWQNISSGMLTESYDVGPVYSTSTNGRFVAPVAGKYMFYAGGWSAGNTNGERYGFGVKVNNGGSPDFITGGNYCITDSPLASYQIVLNLAANDYVELFYFSAISTTLGGTPHYLYWGGYLLG